MYTIWETNIVWISKFCNISNIVAWMHFKKLHAINYNGGYYGENLCAPFPPLSKVWIACNKCIRDTFSFLAHAVWKSY